MSGRVRPTCGLVEAVSKSGPLRATLPVSSVMKASSAGPSTSVLRKSCSNSPTLSPPNVWRRISPEDTMSGQRSPGAAVYKGKSRYASTIRRTASLDTLYSKGHWPGDQYFHSSQLQVDKATQTEDGGVWSCSGSGTTSGRSSRASDDDKLDRFLRSRLQRTPHKVSIEHSSQTTSFWTRYGSPGAGIPLRAARSSVEGLNQEIERLVLYPAGGGSQTPLHDRLRDKGTPEGHRAPLPELFRRSVNTQTPHDMTCATHSSGGSVSSSPDLDGSRLGTSPQINKFLAREPPDGCEKVKLKSKEPAMVVWGGDSRPEGPCVSAPSAPAFQLRPSLTSAFQPLQPAPHNPSGDKR